MLRVYIDTSVIGGVFDEEFQEDSRRLFDEFKNGLKIAVISNETLNELEIAPDRVRTLINEIPPASKELIALNEEALALSNEYIKAKAIPEASWVDARHIALATIHKVDVLASWNFKHLVNLFRIRLYNSVNLRLGYPLLDIRSPKEVFNEEERF